MSNIPLTKLRSYASRGACRMLDLVFPRLCACCKDVITEPNFTQVCERCRLELPLIDPENSCQRCALPLGPFAKEKRHCDGCFRLPFVGFKRAVATGTYEGALAKLLRVFKYAGQPFLIKTFAPLFAKTIWREFDFERPDVITGVPLFKMRFKRRGFDQAELLANVAAKTLNMKSSTVLLERVINTPTLTRLNRAARVEIIKGAFKVIDPALVKDAHVLLIDDVMTTSATVSECAKMLKASGASKVSVAVLARTP